MSPLLLLGVALAGGLGAALRLVVDGEVRRRLGDGLPWGTIVVNLSGSLLLGLVTGLMSGAVLPAAAGTVLGTGFLGGYTTFSTASVELAGLVGRWRAAAVAGIGQLVAAVVLAALGLAAGLALAG